MAVTVACFFDSFSRMLLYLDPDQSRFSDQFFVGAVPYTIDPGEYAQLVTGHLQIDFTTLPAPAAASTDLSAPAPIPPTLTLQPATQSRPAPRPLVTARLTALESRLTALESHLTPSVKSS